LPYFDYRSSSTYWSYDFIKLYRNETYKDQVYTNARRIEANYGYVSGTEFLIVFVGFVIVFTYLRKLLAEGELLSEALKEQRKELKTFWIIVFFGYGFGTVL